MIYTTGTIAGSGNTLTGTGTNFTAAGTLIRNGCTVIVLTSPVQVFQITGVTSATQLAVSPAVNPSIPAGTRYAILLSDSLSVDGLALDIAETFKMYQAYMGGFADVMQSTGTVTITINGKIVTVPGMQSVAQKDAGGAVPVSQGGSGATTAAEARKNFELGTAAQRNAGTAAGEVMPVGSFGLGGRINQQPSWTSTQDVTQFISVPQGGSSPFGNVDGGGLSFSIGNYGVQMLVPMAGDRIVMRSWTPNAFSVPVEFWSTGNTTRASDGTLKAASPVVKLFADDRYETNDESEGVTVTRQAVGVYLVEGCMGLNSDAAWGGPDGGFDIPTDRNKQALVWLDYKVLADGSVLVKTYHRTHPDAPEFARNERDGYVSGDPIDIPAGQFVSVRVEMPENSVYNQKRLAAEAAMAEAEALAIKDAENSDQSINPENQ